VNVVAHVSCTGDLRDDIRKQSSIKLQLRPIRITPIQEEEARKSGVASHRWLHFTACHSTVRRTAATLKSSCIHLCRESIYHSHVNWHTGKVMCPTNAMQCTQQRSTIIICTDWVTRLRNSCQKHPKNDKILATDNKQHTIFTPNILCVDDTQSTICFD
jgi:hypothetical protein